MHSLNNDEQNIFEAHHKTGYYKISHSNRVKKPFYLGLGDNSVVWNPCSRRKQGNPEFKSILGSVLPMHQHWQQLGLG